MFIITSKYDKKAADTAVSHDEAIAKIEELSQIENVPPFDYEYFDKDTGQSYEYTPA